MNFFSRAISNISTVLLIMLLSGCIKEQTHSFAFVQPDQVPQQPGNSFKPVITPMQSGEIPDAMRWKKVTVLSPWGGDYKEPLLNYLRLIENEEYSIETVLLPAMNAIPALGKVRLYLLYGWSGSGSDEMRSATVDSVTMDQQTIRLYTSRPELRYTEAMMGTDDMRFIGWDINIGKLEPGGYQVRLYMKRDVIQIEPYPQGRSILKRDNYSLIKEVGFTVLEVE